MKKIALHLVSIILYFPLVIILFFYLAGRPSKMDYFYIALQALINIFDKGRKIEEG